MAACMAIKTVVGVGLGGPINGMATEIGGVAGGIIKACTVSKPAMAMNEYEAMGFCQEMCAGKVIGPAFQGPPLELAPGP